MKISGNTILVTGGTSGIGRALAEALHAKGNKVVVAGRRQHLLDEIKAKTPGIEGLQVDYADADSVHSFVKQVREKYPKLNVLINNAGISGREDYTAETADTGAAHKIIQTNLVSVVETTSQLLPLLRSQPEATLMVTTSGLAFVPFPAGPTYSATKAFLHSWLEALRFQLRNTKVEVLELAPPYVQTELGGARQAADPRAMPLAEFIAEVVEILESGKHEKGEVLVERVKPLRWAERDGKYAEMLNMLGAMTL